MNLRPQIELPIAWLMDASPISLDAFLLGCESDASNARRKAQEALDEWAEQEAFLLMARCFRERTCRRKSSGR
jgi:hypothetical protein